MLVSGVQTPMIFYKCPSGVHRICVIYFCHHKHQSLKNLLKRGAILGVVGHASALPQAPCRKIDGWRFVNTLFWPNSCVEVFGSIKTRWNEENPQQHWRVLENNWNQFTILKLGELPKILTGSLSTDKYVPLPSSSLCQGQQTASGQWFLTDLPLSWR